MDLTPGEDQKRSDESAARADMRIEVVKRELSQGALSGFDSSVTDYAAKLVIAALDSFDEEALAAEFRRGFEAGEVNAALLREEERSAAYRAGREDAAKAPEDFRLGASDFGEVFLEHAVKGCSWEVQIGGSDNGSPRLELDSVLDAAREHIRTEHNTERGSE